MSGADRDSAASPAIHLRQICLVAADMPAVRADLETVFATPVCHIDPGVAKFGLENILIAFGSQFLEVVAPIREGTAAGRFLDRRGDGGYMVITQVTDKADQEAVRANAATHGVRVAYDSDRGPWHLMQLHPADMGAAFLEVEWDEVGDVTGHWNPAGGTEWRDTPPSASVTAIAAVELQSDDPAALAAHWGAVTGLPVRLQGGHPQIDLANAALRFVRAEDGRGAGLAALDLAVTDPDAITAAARARGLPATDRQVSVCGTRFNLIVR